MSISLCAFLFRWPFKTMAAEGGEPHMEQTEQNTRTIDDQNRVTLPSNLLQKLGWSVGDKLAFNRTRSSIVLSMSKRHDGPRCALCNKLEQEICIGGNDICGSCLQAIKEA